MRCPFGCGVGSGVAMAESASTQANMDQLILRRLKVKGSQTGSLGGAAYASGRRSSSNFASSRGFSTRIR